MKDEEILYLTIKIRRIREKKGTKNNCEYKNKLYCVQTKDFTGGGIGFCEPTLKKAFKRLKELLIKKYGLIFIFCHMVHTYY